jgi:acetylornithine deacetylase/succinyl-diaminopimelate desuccinylase-like protein
MTTAYVHDPVMVDEILAALALKPGDVVVDGTLGLAGHSMRFIDAIRPGGVLVGLDWDESMLAIARQRVGKPEGVTVHLVHSDFRDMKEVLVDCPQVADYAEEAIVRSGLTVTKSSIRGGTDGSRLSFMGLPCPNIFTGEMAIHSKLEYVSVQDMEATIGTIIELCKIWAKKS